MSKLIDQHHLLADLEQMGSRGRAEGEAEDRFRYTLYPVPEHIRAFDPDVTIILGPRGAGKTELFRAVMKQQLLPALLRHARNVRPRLPESSTWVPAYPIGSGFPDNLGISRFFNQVRNPSDVHSGIQFWFAYLCRVLWDRFDDEGRNSLEDLHKQQGGSATNVHHSFQAAGDAPLLALDRLDSMLETEKKHIFVGYDELDTLGGADWKAQSMAITNLIAFWASYTRRWRRIRAKLFLRTDLFERHAQLGGADLAKLAANRAEISWTDRSLYGMLIKRIANQSDELFDYCRDARISFDQDPELGWIPEINKALDARPLVERMVGQYMGANAKKGLAFRWLLEHIRDGRGQALPRPLVRLVEQASHLQEHSGAVPKRPRLLEPSSLRRALDTVSLEHVGSSQDEWRWLEGLKDRVKGQQVPLERKELEQHLRTHWDENWGGEGEIKLPMENPREFVDYLIEVGIFRARTHGRIDAPDLFLEGLGLKRRGGVRKKS